MKEYLSQSKDYFLADEADHKEYWLRSDGAAISLQK